MRWSQQQKKKKNAFDKIQHFIIKTQQHRELHLIMNTYENLHASQNSLVKEQRWRTHTIWYENLLQNYINKTFNTSKRIKIYINGLEYRINIHNLVSWFLTRLLSNERTAFSINDSGKTEYPHAKEWSWTLALYIPYIKINSKLIKSKSKN